MGLWWRLQGVPQDWGGLPRPGPTREIRVLTAGKPDHQHTLNGFTSWGLQCQIVSFNLIHPKVVCKEGIWNMRAYWEVEFSGWVVIGATYEGAGRRASAGPSGLGENEESWGLCWSGTRYQIWYNGVNKDIDHVPHCSTIGVYLDQPAGVIAFYAVTGDGAEQEVAPLHTVKTALDKKILPGFWMGIQSWCTILKRPEWLKAKLLRISSLLLTVTALLILFSLFPTHNLV